MQTGISTCLQLRLDSDSDITEVAYTRYESSLLTGSYEHSVFHLPIAFTFNLPASQILAVEQFDPVSVEPRCGAARVSGFFLQWRGVDSTSLIAASSRISSLCFFHVNSCRESTQMFARVSVLKFDIAFVPRTGKNLAVW
ncbi:MAG: hypothetical protein O3C40_09425 [Planctomycetota bacterium]|nr:hypothetical protein [Planctomycetota bacterium]